MSSFIIKAEKIYTKKGAYYYIKLYQNKFSAKYNIDTYYNDTRIFNGIYGTLENAKRAFSRQAKKYRPFEVKQTMRKHFPKETAWLEELTAYECGLIPVTYDDALLMLDEWKHEGIDDIPRRFLDPQGYKLLADLWNIYIA